MADNTNHRDEHSAGLRAEHERETRAKIGFSIDGLRHETRDDDQEAASLLRLAGLDPAEYDLARVVRGHEPKVFKDGKVVNLHDGDTFISVKQNSPVA